MSAHLVVGLPGAGKSTVLKHLSTNYSDCELISFSAHAIAHVAKTRGTVVERSALRKLFTEDAALKTECVQALEDLVSTASPAKKVVIDSGGSLVDLKAGSLISAYSLFHKIALCSVSVVLAESSDIRARGRARGAWHAYADLSEKELIRKAEDIRLYAVKMAIRKNCSLVLAWNDQVDLCAETLYEGITGAEIAQGYLTQ